LLDLMDFNVDHRWSDASHRARDRAGIRVEQRIIANGGVGRDC
jgi:hypothetical protein